MKKYDLAIIGSGPCGYVAAIRAGRLGLKVVVFEKDRIGGVCLNWGCIPVKSFSAAAMAIYNIERANEFGIDIKGYNIDFSKTYEQKERIVKKLASGIEMLMKARKVEFIKGAAVMQDNTHIAAADTLIEANNILIAAGSIPFEVPGMGFDGTHIVSSSDMVQFSKIPKSIIIVGGGVIGCEFASIFKTLGSEIAVVEMMEQLLPTEDEEISRKITQVFKKRGISVYTKVRAEKIEKGADGVKVVLSTGSVLSAEKMLVCVGRLPNHGGMGLEGLGIEFRGDKRWIKVDEYFRTNISNIYAAGDVKGGALLAHLASREGIAVAETISGKKTSLAGCVVPLCVYTHPEIASVGLNEKTAKGQGLNVRSRKFLFSAISKPHIIGESEGFIKLVVDDNTDRVLGAQIIGPSATELIAELSLCVQLGITSERLAGVIHAHPTLSEAIYEAAEAVHDRAIHSL